MDALFADVKVLIWDFDGTLYQPNEKLWHDIHDAEIRVICEKTGWPQEKAKEEFFKLHRTVIPSATETVAHICNISTPVAAKTFEQYYDRTKYVTRDERLMTLFQKLSGYTHYILANGYSPKLIETLKVLGVPKETFQEIVTSEIVGVNKPHEAGYLYIMKKTELPPEAHMMIGDREIVDLQTAKKLGMNTCLVWNPPTTNIPDVSLPTIYDLTALFPGVFIPPRGWTS